MHRLSLLLLALFATASSFAQCIIRGAVTNESGNPQTSATVVFKGDHFTATSNTSSKGMYVSPKLRPGTYSVTFFAAGYETQRYTDVVLTGNAEIIVNGSMIKSGMWGNSIATRRYVPSPPVVSIPRKKTRYKLTGVYPSGAATFDVSRSRSSRVAKEVTYGSGRGDAVALKRSTATFSSGVPARYGDASGGVVSMPAGAAPSVTITDRRSTAVDEAPGIASSEKAVMISSEPAARAGSLTSGEINDFSKWTLWEDISTDALKTYRNTWSFRPEERYTVIIKSRNGAPLCNARVKMSDGSKTWEAITDNTGKAELWYGMWDTAKANPPRLSAAIEYGSQHYNIENLKSFASGPNILATNLPCLNPAKLDIAFIVDATGSMQDEINYLKAELRDILQKVQDSMPAMQVQTGAIFYRDISDTYVTRVSDLTPDFSKTEAFIADNNADGGGDFPEAVDVALQEGLNSIHWRADATTRLAFLVLDAPPHSDAATVKRMQELTAQYAARGIRLIPVVCSGSDKSTEYLMRSLALATNGTYLFLTDHSGIGGSHTAPTTDKYDVEYLNGLIYRVIYNNSYMPACLDAAHPRQDTALVSSPVSDSGQLVTWRYFPNPTTGVLHIEHTHTSGFLLITDITGKAVLRVPADASGKTTIDLGQYPAGVYMIRYSYADDKWLSGKFVVVH